MASSLKYTEFIIRVPVGEDTSFFKSLSKRMGWLVNAVKPEAVYEHEPNECTLRAMEDALGRVHHAKSAEDLIHQIIG